MKRYKFYFKTDIKFDLPVTNHNFLLKCFPKNFVCQKIFDEKIVMEPDCSVSMGEDSFGNRTLGGTIIKPHSNFSFSVEGRAMLSKYRIEDDLDRIFLYPSEKTVVTDTMKEFLNTLDLPENVYEKVQIISKAVHNKMVYTKAVTNAETTGGEAFELGQGVCQDYAHILIGLLRERGIPARYCTGFIEGDGETHAWVEYYDKGSWYGIDPTNDINLEYGYIKLSCGRDAGDCSVERGCFVCSMGIVKQTTTVEVRMEEEL